MLSVNGSDALEVSCVIVDTNELKDPSALTRNISILPELNAATYFSSLENIKGSRRIFWSTMVKSVTASLVESVVVTLRSPVPKPSLVTVTTAAPGLVDVNPVTALRAVNILSAVTSFDVFARTKCLLPTAALGEALPAVSNSRVIFVPSLKTKVSCVPTAIFA